MAVVQKSRVIQPDGGRVIEPNGTRQISGFFGRQISSTLLVEALRKETRKED